MKVKSIILLFAGLFCLAFFSAQAQGASGPKIVIAEREHDFGTVYQGAELKQDFEITNQGDAPLVIEKIPSS
jgi:hypothetical protein